MTISKYHKETPAQYADRLEREAGHCERGAMKEWAHHAAHSRKGAHDMRKLAAQVRTGDLTGVHVIPGPESDFPDMADEITQTLVTDDDDSVAGLSPGR